jgi:hypothetical protein
MMNVGSFVEKGRSYKLLAFFILGWVLLNVLQAAFTGIYPDEAYYWVYSRHLQWGYFDHPPMVAAMVKFGELFHHGYLFTRLGTVLFSAGTIVFLFKALPEEIKEIKIFIIAFLSVVIFHVYGFIATPDAALFFFTAAYFYAYKLYLQKQSFRTVIFLSLCIVGMLYSKYHGILPVFFTFLSNPRLILKPSAWIIVFLVLLLLSPHIYWQYQHDWPTIKYHLSERVASSYRISKTTNYIFSQFLVWCPVTALPAFYYILKIRRQGLYVKAHQFNLWGVLLFFLLSSINSSIEPHWTLVAGASFLVLLQIVLVKISPGFQKTFSRLALVSIVLVMVGRILFVLPQSPLAKVSNLKHIFFAKERADSIYKHAKGIPVIFNDGYGAPALYQYYHPDVSTSSYNTINYRRNHYSISDDEPMLNNKKVYYGTVIKIDSADIFVNNKIAPTYLHLIDSFKAVNSLRADWPDAVRKARAGDEREINLSLENKLSQRLVTKYTYLEYVFYKTRKERILSEKKLIPFESFAAGEKKNLQLTLQFPKEQGKYYLVFSILSIPFDGTLGSEFYHIKVE